MTPGAFSLGTCRELIGNPTRLSHHEVLPAKLVYLADDDGDGSPCCREVLEEIVRLCDRHADKQSAGGLGVVEELQSRRVGSSLEVRAPLGVFAIALARPGP